MVLILIWIEKQEGNKEGMTYAEPLSDIHMPNNSIIPFVMTFGLFVAAFGALIQWMKKIGQFQLWY